MISLLQQFRQWIGLQFDSLLLKTCEKKEFDGIILYAIDEEQSFFDIAIKSLQLIKNIDSRRYEKVKRYLQSIAFVQMGSGCYMHRLRSFFVDELPKDTEYFASSIIHEMTHGLLMSKGFLYVREKQEQHERICVFQQFKFLEKAILNKKELSKEEQQKEILRYKKYFEDSIKRQWWNRKIQNEKRINRLKSFLKKEFIKKTHYVNGNLESEIRIVNGKMNGPYKVYYENGELKDEMNYHDDKMEGIVRHYYPDGSLEWEANYVSGNYQGVYKAYSKSGVLVKEGNYKDGECHGTYRWYNEDGSLKKEVNYQNGEKVEDSKSD
jgi:antitoxin component YwqK of YwqJK toxin-antitoxin module